MSFIQAQIRFKNSVFMNALERKGYKSIASFQRDLEIESYQNVIDYASLKRIPKSHEVRLKYCKLLYEDEYSLFDQYVKVVEDNGGAKALKYEIPKEKYLSLTTLNTELLEEHCQDYDNEIDQGMVGESLSIDVKKALEELQVRERDIVKMFYGIGYGGSYRIEEISKKYKISSTRIGQIKEKALRKLRHYDKTNILREYVGLQKHPEKREHLSSVSSYKI